MFIPPFKENKKLKKLAGKQNKQELEKKIKETKNDIKLEKIKFLMDFHLMDMMQGFLMSSRYLQI